MLCRLIAVLFFFFLMQVDVKVHLCNEEEREARTEIAAALAESARQLAQSAANFDQEELEERQKRGWYSKSLPHYSHSSLPYRTTLGTTHSLPLHSNKRKLFPSYSSTNLPPHSREHVYTPTLPSSGHTPPTASLDHPRHMVSTDHPYAAYDYYRKNSFNHRPPPPESPLSSRQNSRLSSPSGRSQSSNLEYGPGHYHNLPLPPVHVRPHRVLSRRVSEPGCVGDGAGGLYQNHNPAFLSHVHFNRQRGVMAANPLAVASLDFNSPKSQSQKSHIPRSNGMTNPIPNDQDLQAQLLGDVNFRRDLLEVGGMRNENGSDSNNSTLCGSSHSSTMENKNRLSRVSEKSEHNENETDSDQKAHQRDNKQVPPCMEEGREVNCNHSSKEMGMDPSSVTVQRGRPPPDHEERDFRLPSQYRKVDVREPPPVMVPPTTVQSYNRLQSSEEVEQSSLTPSSSQEMVSLKKKSDLYHRNGI